MQFFKTYLLHVLGTYTFAIKSLMLGAGGDDDGYYYYDLMIMVAVAVAAAVVAMVTMMPMWRHMVAFGESNYIFQLILCFQLNANRTLFPINFRFQRQ